MARISTIDYSRFGNENYLSFCRELCTIIAAYAVVGQRFGYLVRAYEAAVEELDEAMKQPIWSDRTEPIRKKDEARDKVLLSVKAMIESMRHYSPIEGVSTDAEKVYRFVKLNTLNPAAQYDKETAQISNFLQDLERYCQPEVERMGLQTALTELKRLNDKMAELLALRDMEDSLKKAEAVKQARRKLDQLYVALKDTVNGAALVDIAGELTPFIDAVNQMLKRLETQVLKNPTTQKPADSETPDNPDTPDNTPDNNPDNNPGGDNTDNNNPSVPGDSVGGDNNGGDNNDNQGGGNNGDNNYPPGYDPDADDDPGV